MISILRSKTIKIVSCCFSPNDDSFFVLHTNEYDNIFDCKMLPEALNRLAVVFQLDQNSELKLNVTEK